MTLSRSRLPHPLVLVQTATRRLRRGLLLAALCGAAACAEDKPQGETTAGPTTIKSEPSGAAEAGAPPDASATPSAVPTASVTSTGSAAATTTATTTATATKEKDAGPKPEKDAGAAPKASAVSDAGAPSDAGASAATTTTASPPVAAPVPGSANEVAAQVDTIFLPKKTFSAKFKQEHTQKVSGTVKKSSGVVFVEKPSKISFRYDPPNKNRIVSDGSEIKIYVAEDNTMYIQPVAGHQMPGAMAFIMGNGLLPSFEFTFNEKAKKTWPGGPVLNGKPRQATPNYESCFFYVDDALLQKKDPGVIRRVLILDAQGNRNRFDFEESTQPASIDPGEFVFTPPPGTDIKKGSEAKK
jgi:outer membrane lipoprotein-sorting protein